MTTMPQETNTTYMIFNISFKIVLFRLRNPGDYNGLDMWLTSGKQGMLRKF
jgi:hypothetical protein